MARKKSSASVSAQSPAIALSCAANPLLVNTMEYRRLLELAKNEAVHGKSRQAFESALKSLSEQATKTVWHDSHRHANLNTFCAEIMSDVLSTSDVGLIKITIVSLAPWLVPKAISKIASACQQYGWNTMIDT